jgi:hypothetical protein
MLVKTLNRITMEAEQFPDTVPDKFLAKSNSRARKGFPINFIRQPICLFKHE